MEGHDRQAIGPGRPVASTAFKICEASSAEVSLEYQNCDKFQFSLTPAGDSVNGAATASIARAASTSCNAAAASGRSMASSSGDSVGTSSSESDDILRTSALELFGLKLHQAPVRAYLARDADNSSPLFKMRTSGWKFC